jgi:hypothetical protein
MKSNPKGGRNQTERANGTDTGGLGNSGLGESNRQKIRSESRTGLLVRASWRIPRFRREANSNLLGRTRK